MEGIKTLVQHTPPTIKEIKPNRDLSPEEVHTVTAGLTQIFIDLEKYAESPEEVLSYPDWHSRKENLWTAIKFCRSHVIKLHFRQWIEQGNESLMHHLDKLDADDIKLKAKSFRYETKEDLSDEGRLEIFWEEDQHAYKWFMELLVAVGKGPYDKYFAADLSDAVRDGAAAKYLRFVKQLGFDTNDLEDHIAHYLTKKRFYNDRSSVQQFMAQLNGQQELPLMEETSTNGHVPV